MMEILFMQIKHIMFIDTLNTIFSDSKYTSSLFVCGDFNIDLLKNG